MVRISDILKQGGNLPEPNKPGKEKEAKPEEQPSQGVPFAKAISENQPPEEKEVHIAKTMRQMQLEPQELQNIYNDALEAVKEILNQLQSQDENLNLTNVRKSVENIVNPILVGNKEIISLITNYSKENYLYAHSVNVCIISLYVGLGLGYNKSRLNELGLGAILHDLGMMKVYDISQEPRALSEDEFKEIKKHPVYTSEILCKIENIEEGIRYIAKQTHERLNGLGYPEGLGEQHVHEYARIVAVADVYEALIHPRPYREAMSPHDAVKELLNMSYSGTLDGGKIIKILINEIGIYPAGNWVELSTGEIGKVVLCNPDWPLRPKVNIIFSPDKELLPQIKSINLSQNLNIFIKRSINPKDLNLTV